MVLVLGVLAPWIPGDRAAGQSWTTIQAQDRSFIAQIPTDWTVTSAVFQNFTARSPRGEILTVASDDVLADAQSLQNSRTACQQYGTGCQFRFWAPPLAPLDVVRLLFPQYSPSMQSTQILTVWPLNVAGFQGALVRYKFLEQGTLMEGFADTFTVPGVATPQLRYWSFVTATAAGPRQIFRRNVSFYARILDSLQYSPEALKKIARAPLELGEALREIDRKFGQQWNHTLAGQARFPNGATVPWDDLIPGFDSYTCGTQGLEVIQVPHNFPKPRVDCVGPVNPS